MKYLTLYLLLSLAALADVRPRPVDVHGALRTEGAKIVGQDGQPVSLAGTSLFWSQWEGQFWNASCVDWLQRDWHSDIIRAAVGVEGGGYLDHPAVEQARVERVADAAIAAGLYVIIDWHDHYANRHTAEAVKFFQAMARQYGSTPNIIYEIFNEPTKISWSHDIKPYAQEVMAAIRAIDREHLIIVGTPTWSQDVDAAADDPLDDRNVAYALHFYAGTHKQYLRDKADYALRKGRALFVTEWGTCNADGAGPIDQVSTMEWMGFLRSRQLSHCNWAVSEKAESASIVRPGSSGTGGWKESELTPSGKLVRSLMLEWPKPAAASLP